MKPLIGAIALGLISLAVSSAAQCPNISVMGPPGITSPGDSMIFRVEGSTSQSTFNWTVSRGLITAGQGTRTITVMTDKTIQGMNVTATVEVGGLPPSCQATGSETAPVAQLPEWEPLDEWNGKLTNDDVRSRLDNFFADLANNPTHIGLVTLRTPAKERRDSKNRRLRLIVEHARWRKFDITRIWFCFEPFFEPRTMVWRFHPGLMNEVTCKTLIKGKDI